MSKKDTNSNHPFIVWAACILWIISIFAILWSLLLFFGVGDVLFLTGTDLVNALVLLSGILMLPTNLYIVYAVAKGETIDANANVICCRLRTCIIWIIVINTIGIIFCIQRIYCCYEITMKYISNSMQQYRTVPKHKHFIDNLQWSLGCCGLHSYKDWFTRDWHDKVRDYEWSPQNSRDTKSVIDSVNEETDSVPLSCCKSGSCVSNYLKELGTFSISTSGCGDMMYRIIMISMSVHIFMFLLVIVLEGLLLKYSNSKKKSFTSNLFRNRSRKSIFNIRNIMSINDNFDVSSGSYLLNEESDEIDANHHCQEDVTDEK